MYSNMCVKIALCLALIVSIDGSVLKFKHHQVPLSPEGMTVEITVKNKGDKHPVSTMKIDIDEQDKKVVMSMAESPTGVLKHHRIPDPVTVPTLGDRAGVIVGTCPSGYTRHKRFCIPNNY